MKVGVVVEGGLDTGGVYQLEMAILHALKNHTSTSRHSFVVFTYAQIPDQEILEQGALSFVKLPWPKARHRLERKVGILAQRAPWPKWIHRIQNSLQRSMDAHEIEVAYFPCEMPDCLAINMPFILNVWDLQHRLQPIFPEVSARGAWERRERFYSLAIRQAARIIAESEQGKRYITQFYGVPEDRIVVHHLLPATFVTDDPAGGKARDTFERFKLPLGYVFYPAQFWPHKNHAGLLYAIHLLKEQHKITMPVVFTGSDKGNLSYIKELAGKLGLAAQTHFLGLVPNQVMPGLYQRAFALVMPTYFGPTNVPPLEAFTLGCPVITSDLPGIREQMKDAALLVDPRDPSSICNAIISLHQNPELRSRLIDRGYAQVKQWTPANLSKSLLSILDDLEPIRRCWK